MIDNWAHLFGFAFGYLFSVGCRPYRFLCKKDLGEGVTAGRVVVSIVHLGLAIFIFLVLVTLFYVSPVYECNGCSYFNCIPITSTFCDGMEVKIGRSYE